MIRKGRVVDTFMRISHNTSVKLAGSVHQPSWLVDYTTIVSQNIIEEEEEVYCIQRRPIGSKQINQNKKMIKKNKKVLKKICRKKLKYPFQYTSQYG